MLVLGCEVGKPVRITIGGKVLKVSVVGRRGKFTRIGFDGPAEFQIDRSGAANPKSQISNNKSQPEPVACASGLCGNRMEQVLE